ncbi:hypothetical protein FRC11_003192 [Ceratobasidium sp. 423]|nr:hypothetical protein FRC11_003192 [Ceratobasidium sp. 423]
MRNSSAPVSVSNTQASTGVIIGLKAGILTQSTVPGETLSSSDSEAAIPPPNQAGFTVKLNNAAIRQKCDTEDNSIKEHVRSTFYRMLGIVAAKDVRPYFKDEHGELDTPPAQFMDPGWYCQPFPHWRAPLAKQVAWDPYIERFRLAIPNDDSELSNKLRSLTDEQIIVLLNDGPFKLGQTAWRDMKKIE